jgi:transglutaminase-like putative cysteine protease
MNVLSSTASASLRQRLASLPRDTRDTLFLLAVIAWVLLPQVAHTPWWACAFAASLLLWRGQLAWRASPLPGRMVLAGLLLVAVAATWATHRTLVGRDAGVTLVVLLLALKTLELRARRDAMVVFFLGFFALLSNFFHSQSPLTALAMIAGLVGLLTALVNAHMTAGKPPLAQALRTASLLALWGAPAMLALFVFFPRMAPLWGVPSDDLAGRSGLSENMRVGEVASLALDDGVALRLRFLTPDGAAPPAAALYFRGPVLAHFDGRTWQAHPLGAAMEPQLRVSGEPLRYEMLIEPSKRRWLPLLDAVSDAPQLPEGSSAGRARMAGDLQWLTQHPITDVLRVSAQSHVQFQYGPLQPARELRRHLQLPAEDSPGGNPRTHALGRQLLASLADPGDTRALVQKVLERLRSGGYVYTLEPGMVDALNTADDFWFDSKQGFCEHIASAFAVLMRSMGVPARIVTGYQGGERNSVDGYWTVRNSDAHAWAEVWIAGQGWVRVDPTGAVSPARVGRFQRLQAPRGAIASAVGNLVDTGTLDQLRAFWEAANNRWNQWVINYTQSRQLHLLQSLGLQSPDGSDLLRLLGASLGALALLWLLRARLTRPRPDAWNQLLGEARARMQRSGIAAGPATSARALAQLAQTQWAPAHAPLSQALGSWLLDMEKLRYAPRPHAASPADCSADLASLRRRWRQLRAMPWPPSPQTPPSAPETNPPATAGLHSSAVP